MYDTIKNQKETLTKQKIKSALLHLLKTKDITNVSVTLLCKEAQINRSTFYDYYYDMVDLAETIKVELENHFDLVYQEQLHHKNLEHVFLDLFYHIKEHQELYQIYFHLHRDLDLDFAFYDSRGTLIAYDKEMYQYDTAFFRAGFLAVIKEWLKEGCLTPPERLYRFVMTKCKT